MSVQILHSPFSILHLDDDGLTDWEEVKRHHTNPHDADTDGDGLLDGYEVQNETNPLNPDSDSDGMPDGWGQEQYAAHRLLNGEEGDRTITISLQASTPASNHAVLRIGDLPILLGEANTWTFSIPTGTVWNVELRTDGLPVQLALVAGMGIFAENADDIFVLCLLEEDQPEPLRSASPPTRSAAGSRGGSGKIIAPCIYLEPSMQVVHENESATVWAKCVPDTPSLSGKLTWSFEPDFMAAYVDVANDKLSATVSGMDDEWHSSVTLHANAGNSLTTQAMVHFCNGHSNPTNGIAFPPNHTNMTINPIYRNCEHPFNDDEEDLFPVRANIIVVGPDVDVPQPHKTAVINVGKYNGPYPDLYGEALGLTPNPNCHERNDSPSGSSDVYNGTIREYILNWYNAFYIDPDIKSYNDWRNVPLPFSADLMPLILSQTALHEICHTMGLVPAASAVGGGHNNCQDGSHYMDDGILKRPLMRLGFDLWHIQRWMPENRNYLQFIFPQAY